MAREISVQVSPAYLIHIGSGLLRHYDTAAWPGELALITNTVVGELYGNALQARLESAGHRVVRYDAPDGEGAKSLEQMAAIYDRLAERNLSRRGAVIALGGGVVGDLAGFVAATWMRGVPLVQIPTTLLAMVDSSVGGKTGINHPRAKNLIGAFHQPAQVLIDPQCLQTLPSRELSCGLAEVIKYGIIADADFFGWLEAHLDEVLALDDAAVSHVIERCCALKASVVEKDERESDASGLRATLNYGHTTGHALEAVATYGTLHHGEGVSIGMMVAARLAGMLGTCADQALLSRQQRLLERAGLPVTIPAELDPEALWQAMTLDKKSRDGKVNFILPEKLGRVRMVPGVSRDQIMQALTQSTG